MVGTYYRSEKVSAISVCTLGS